MEERIYRNIWKEIGISDAQVEERLSQLISTFFYDEKERLYFPVGDDMAYIEDTGNNDARTEGMSYGMMLCVQLDMKEEFDRIWKWAKTYMYMEEGENEGYFAWSCQTDGTKNSYGPAPDGEEYFAMALFFASHRWGDGEGILHMKKKQKSCFAPAFIKEKMADQESPCGIVKISRFCLCQDHHLLIHRIICLIFMSCLQSGHTRKIVRFGQKLRKSAVNL